MARFPTGGPESIRQRLEHLFQSTTDAFILLDHDGKITFLNRAAASLFGEPGDRLIGTNFWKESPPPLGATLESEYRRACREEKTAELEYYFPTTQRWFSVRIFSAPDGPSLLFQDCTDRKRTEEALRRSTDRFRLAASGEAITLYEQDSDLRYTWLYPNHQEHAGALGKTDDDILGSEQGKRLTQWKREVLSTGVSQKRELRVQLPSGPRFYEMTILAKRNGANQIIGVAGAALDISDQKVAQEASQRLASIVESSDDAIISKSLDGIVTSWNRSAERIFGYTAEEILGKNIALLLPSDRRDELTVLGRMQQGHRIDHYETVRQHKNGSSIQVSLTLSPIRDKEGQIVGISKIARDVTRRRQSEQQQQALYELVARVNRAEALPEIYQAALDAICRCQQADRAAILLRDADGVMRFKAWRGLSDSYRRAVEGHSPWSIDDPAPKTICIEDTATIEVNEEVRTAIREEGIGALAFIPLTSEKRLLGKFMVYYNAARAFEPEVLRPAETIASQIAFALERQRSEEALEALVDERTGSLRAAIAQMEEFSYSVSHDLRSPARSMQGYANALLEDYGDRLDAAGRDYLGRIIRSSTRMDRLIQDILTYSRLSRRELQLHPVLLDKLVLEVIQQYPEMRCPKAEISVAQPLLPVVGHEPSVSQILSNLLGNAVKFVAPGALPKVHVSTERQGDRVRLWIVDNGIGIKAEHHGRLFGMFERIHPDQRYEGTGIGLAIVRKAAERMGGAAGVVSDGASGSRFWVELPAA